MLRCNMGDAIKNIKKKGEIGHGLHHAYFALTFNVINLEDL